MSLLFFFKISWRGYLETSAIPYEFEDWFFISAKKAVGILTKVVLNL